MADFSPARGAVAVTPSDTVNLVGGACRGLYVGTAGNVAVVDTVGSVVTYTALAVGIVHPIQATRINNTNTTASNIVALY
jgi:hypothetical protein